MLTVNHLSIKYGDRTIVNDISFELTPGKVVVLIGPNGSGKTTIIRGITGAVPLEGGNICFGQTDMKTLSEVERARKIGVVPQSSHLPDDFTVYNTVALGRTPYLGFMGRLSDSDKQIVDHAIRETSIESLQDKNIKSLSGGEQQRVILAQALAQDAPIMILDEPTSHLDLNYKLSLLTIVKNLSREKNVAVLMVLHDLNLASRFADEILILKNGLLQAAGDPAEVMTEKTLSSVYQVPMSVITLEESPYPMVVPK